MKILIILSLSLLSTLTGFVYNTSNEKSIERAELINKIVSDESDFATAHCFCRIGDHRGDRLNSYPNALKDFGKIKKYKGWRPQNNSNDDNCGDLCSKKAFEWANSLSNDQLCNYIEKTGSQRIVAYAKVGTRKWTVRQTLKNIKCCQSPGTIICPSGWNPEPNFFDKCSKYVCDPILKGYNGVLNTNSGSNWGFVFEDRIYQLRQGKLSGGGWSECN